MEMFYEYCDVCGAELYSPPLILKEGRTVFSACSDNCLTELKDELDGNKKNEEAGGDRRETSFNVQEDR